MYFIHADLFPSVVNQFFGFGFDFQLRPRQGCQQSGTKTEIMSLHTGQRCRLPTACATFNQLGFLAFWWGGGSFGGIPNPSFRLKSRVFRRF